MKTTTSSTPHRMPGAASFRMACGFLAIFCLTVLPSVSAFAEPTVPETWKAYGHGQFELKKGLRMYHAEGEIVVDRDKGVAVAGFPGEELLRLSLEQAHNAPKVFARIANEKQARDLCELLIHGGLVADDQAYQGLLRVHREAGCEQVAKDGQLAFDQVAKTVEGGFQVEFTAFHMPDAMGAGSVVARYRFTVGKDASVKVESTPYLRGLCLNWQTAMLETKEERVREGKALARVEKFISDCLIHCPNKLPANPKG